MNRNWDGQVGRMDQEFDSRSSRHRNRAGNRTATGRNIEHRALANLGLLGCGKEDTQFNGNSWVFSTFDHGDLHT